jgi:hypothetical protein
MCSHLNFFFFLEGGWKLIVPHGCAFLHRIIFVCFFTLARNILKLQPCFVIYSISCRPLREKGVSKTSSEVSSDALIPWRRILLQNKTVIQLVNKFPAFYATRMFTTVFTTAHLRTCVTFRNKLCFFFLRWGVVSLSPAQFPGSSTTHFRLSATVYLIHSQLPYLTNFARPVTHYFSRNRVIRRCIQNSPD